MIKSNKIKAIVFDFGGVIESYPQGSFSDLFYDQLKFPVSTEQFKQAWELSKDEFSVGRVSLNSFCDLFLTHLKIALTPTNRSKISHFLSHSFNINKLVFSIVKQLKTRYRVIMLSNNYLIVNELTKLLLLLQHPIMITKLKNI